MKLELGPLSMMGLLILTCTLMPLPVVGTRQGHPFLPCPTLHFNTPFLTLHTGLFLSQPLSAARTPQLLGWPFPTCTVLCSFFDSEICTVYFVFLYACPDLIQIHIFNKFHELIVLDAVLGTLGIPQNQDRHTPQRLTSRRADRRGKRPVGGDPGSWSTEKVREHFTEKIPAKLNPNG